jgi:hypothetical protein
VRVRGYISVVLGCPIRRQGRGRAGGGHRRPRCTRWARTRCRSATPIGTGTAGKTQALIARRAARSVDALAGTSTTRTARRSRTSTRRWRAASPRSTARSPARRCPYAKGATGNVASEDVLYLLQGSASRPASTWTAARAGAYISAFLGRAPRSRVRARARRKDPLAVARRGARSPSPCISVCGWTPRGACASAACARSTRSPRGACSTTASVAACWRKSRAPRADGCRGAVPDAER